MNRHIKRDFIKQDMARYIKKATPPIEIIDVLLIALVILGALIAIVNTL